MLRTTGTAGRAISRRETWVSYMFLLPSLVFFLGFVILPMVIGFVTSFFNYTMTDFQFIGFQNYLELFQDPIFHKALKNTLLIVVVSVPIVLLFSLWVSAALVRMSNFWRSFYRIIFYLPVITGTVAVTVVWKWMFNNYYGLFNQVLGTKINWLGDTRYAIWCIIAILISTSIGQPIVLYVAALSNVDKSIIEAAEVDGATSLQVFWKIKWPAIKPTTLYILVITTINSFQCFALIQLLTSGGPKYSTQTIMYYIYYVAFKLNRYGYGTAMGMILTIIIALFSFLQFKLTKSGETH